MKNLTATSRCYLTFSSPCQVFAAAMRPLYYAALLWVLTLPASAANYFVDNIHGSDAYPGSAARPWQTLSHGVAALAAGDTLIVRSNGPKHPYREQVLIEKRGTEQQPLSIVGESPTNPPLLVGATAWSDIAAGGTRRWSARPNQPRTVSVAADSPPQQLLVAPVSAWQTAGMDALQTRQERRTEGALAPGEWRYSAATRRVDYHLLESERIDALHVEATHRHLVTHVRNASHVQIRDLRYRYSGKTTIRVTNSTHVLLRDLQIENAGQNAIVASEGDNIGVENCHINQAGNNGIVFDGSATNPLSASHISGCVIANIANNDCITLHKNANGEDIGANFTLQDNQLSFCAEQGIDVTSGRNVALRRNVTFNNGVSGIVIGHDVTDIDIIEHLSRDEASNANIIIGRSANVRLIDSCLRGNQRHVLVINRARNVSVSGTTLYQGPEATSSVIDISATAVNIRLDNNYIASQTNNAGYMLRYLRGASPNSARATFKNNQWYFLQSKTRPIYTDELEGHSFLAHNLLYEYIEDDAYIAIEQNEPLNLPCL